MSLPSLSTLRKVNSKEAKTLMQHTSGKKCQLYQTIFKKSKSKKKKFSSRRVISCLSWRQLCLMKANLRSETMKRKQIKKKKNTHWDCHRAKNANCNCGLHVSGEFFIISLNFIQEWWGPPPKVPIKLLAEHYLHQHCYRFVRTDH